MPRPHARPTLLAVSALLAAGACAGRSRAGTTPALTDANIAAIVVAANDQVIAHGRIAVAKSADPRVRAFGEMMQRDHGGVNAAAAALAGRLGLVPAEETIALDLRDETEAVRDSLQDVHDAAFDRFYADHQMRYHRRLLGLMEQQLLPSVRHDSLAALLRVVLPVVRTHTALAEQLREQVGPR